MFDAPNPAAAENSSARKRQKIRRRQKQIVELTGWRALAALLFGDSYPKPERRGFPVKPNMSPAEFKAYLELKARQRKAQEEQLTSAGATAENPSAVPATGTQLAANSLS